MKIYERSSSTLLQGRGNLALNQGSFKELSMYWGRSDCTVRNQPFPNVSPKIKTKGTGGQGRMGDDALNSRAPDMRVNPGLE